MINKIIICISLRRFSFQTIGGNNDNIYLFPLTDLIQCIAKALLLICIQKSRLIRKPAFCFRPYRKGTCQA